MVRRRLVGWLTVMVPLLGLTASHPEVPSV